LGLGFESGSVLHDDCRFGRRCVTQHIEADHPAVVLWSVVLSTVMSWVATRTHQVKGNAMLSGNPSASGSGPLTASEWAAIVSSLAFVTLWLGMSFA
jgi:hypothetical protein